MLKTIEHSTDLCIVGGGLAGMSAAISAARAGIQVVLMQERPVLGGNASSEIRMWVCGAQGENNRETGLIEEIALENLYRNPTKNYYIWDSILYEFVKQEKNITLLLNCTCIDAETKRGSFAAGRDIEIQSVTGYQLTTQTYHKITAKLFADCSGDSILAPLTGAMYRVGREASAEFGEKVSQKQPDKQTMGMSCLLYGRQTDRKIAFTAPRWAKKLTPEDIALRKPNIYNTSENFWYLELGGNRDSIGDTEEVRDELLALALGMWDYVKNSGDYDADTWELDFLGFLPGKRESRRMVGEYIMTQLDVLDGGKFEDIVAYGGWGLDDHHPDGFYHTGNPNVWGDTPSPYGIPYRTLYSKNVCNLFFAGRNISMTHAAMSSARVMGTCAVLGQAVGFAASIAVQKGLQPHGVYEKEIPHLQKLLMDADCFIPYTKRPVSDLCKYAKLSGADDRIRNGCDRNNIVYGDAVQSCSIENQKPVTYILQKPQEISSISIVFDSDLNRVTLPGDTVENTHSTRANTLLNSPQMAMPKTLCREFKVDFKKPNGETVTLLHETDNKRRKILLPIQQEATEVSLTIIRNWGNTPHTNLFSFDLE